MLEHRKLQLAKQPLINFIHLRVAGEEHEGASARDLEQPANDPGSLAGELRRARIGQIGRDVENRLAFVIEVRGDDQFARVIEPEPLPYVFEAAADGQRGRGEHRSFQLRPQALAQNLADFDRSGLQKNIGAALPAGLKPLSQTRTLWRG